MNTVQNPFIVAAFVSVVFLILAFFEMRFIQKESKPLKTLFKDALMVYISTLSGLFLITQLLPNSSTEVIQAFTDEPGF